MLSITAVHPGRDFRTETGSSVVAWSPSACTLVLTGELDLASCARISSDVERLLSGGFRRIRIDLEAVTFIDAATVAAFLRARELARSLGGDVALIAASGSPLRVLRLLDLERELSEAGPARA